MSKIYRINATLIVILDRCQESLRYHHWNILLQHNIQFQWCVINNQSEHSHQTLWDFTNFKWPVDATGLR